MRTILLGAGASAEAGVPPAKPMAEQIYATLKKDPVLKKAIDVAIGGLRFHRSIEQSDPFGDIDVEDLYEILRTLGDRNSSLIASFVGSWSPAINLAESAPLDNTVARAMLGLQRDVHRAAEGLTRSNVGRRGIDFDPREFSMHLSDALKISAGQGANTFALAAHQVLKMLSYLSWVTNKDNVRYMLPLVASAADSQLWVATLNYDNTLEVAAQQLGIEMNLGISADKTAVAFNEAAQFNLAKLHGSVNWEYDFTGGKWIISNHPVENPELIFGSGNKLRINGPYLDLLFAFRSRLEKSDELITCGYSFRDSHINYLIMNWIFGDSSRHVLVVDPYLTMADIENSMNQSIAPHGVIIKPGALDYRIKVSQIKASEWIASTYKMP